MTHPDPLEAAKTARKHTRAAFLSTVEQGQKVRREVDRMHEHVRQNGFGDALEMAMQGTWRHTR